MVGEWGFMDYFKWLDVADKRYVDPNQVDNTITSMAVKSEQSIFFAMGSSI